MDTIVIEIGPWAE